MVSTRHHPREFPPPEPTTPTQSSSPSLPADNTPSTPPAKSSALTKSPKKSPTKRKTSAMPTALVPSSATATTGYTHVPNTFVLVWLVVSLILVAWDSIYVLGRPHTMPGGKFHSPFYTPYALYGTIDYMYGWPAWNNNVGFTAAQGLLNVLESLGYVWYLAVVWIQGSEGKKQFWKQSFSVQGEGVGLAVLVCFSTAVATLWKTLLYWANEAFSNFENIGHNDPVTLVLLWIVPNGLWLVLPAYIMWVLGTEILEGLGGLGSKEKLG